jgi:hypothetical protein
MQPTDWGEAFRIVGGGLIGGLFHHDRAGHLHLANG